MDQPTLDESGWAVTRPYQHNRYTWENDTWKVVIRDMGSSSLWGVHARRKDTGRTFTFGNGHSVTGEDGFQPLFGAAVRLVSGNMHPTDKWEEAEFPQNLDHIF